MAKHKNKQPQPAQPNVVVVDMDNAVLGRASSKVAKLLLEGNKVILLNAEKAIITGRARWTVDDHMNRHQIKTATNPRRGPFTQKQPDRIVRRTVRGMLPMKKSSGRMAFRRLQVHIGVPEEFTDADAIALPEGDAGMKVRRSIPVSRISNEFGWTEKGKR